MKSIKKANIQKNRCFFFFQKSWKSYTSEKSGGGRRRRECYIYATIKNLYFTI